MKNPDPKANWLIDAALFGGLILASLLDLTGLGLHQWLGLAVSLLAAYHLLSHWPWVSQVTRRWFGRTSSQARRFLLVDFSLLTGFSLILLSGLLISTWINLSLSAYDAWRDLHITVTLVTLALVVLKIGLHARWIVHTTRRYFSPPAAPPQTVPQSVQVKTAMDRRDFLKLMGVAGAASLLAALSALAPDESLMSASSSNSTASSQSGNEIADAQSSETAFSELAVSSNNNDGSCTVRCNRGCSYPGHCRKYIDRNSNNLCDLGECA